MKVTKCDANLGLHFSGFLLGNKDGWKVKLGFVAKICVCEMY